MFCPGECLLCVKHVTVRVVTTAELFAQVTILITKRERVKANSHGSSDVHGDDVEGSMRSICKRLHSLLKEASDLS